MVSGCWPAPSLAEAGTFSEHARRETDEQFGWRASRARGCGRRPGRRLKSAVTESGAMRCDRTGLGADTSFLHGPRPDRAVGQAAPALRSHMGLCASYFGRASTLKI